MKKFNNFLKKNLKFIIILIVAIIITSMISVYAAYSYLATDVSYTKPDVTGTSVKAALDELYKKATIVTVPLIDCTGNYADINGDGTVDGLIFADLAFAGSGTWGSELKTGFSYSAVTSGLKSYYISKESYSDSIWGTHVVISPVSGTSGTDRFYIMSLTDFDSSDHYWYYSANMSDYSSYTSFAFGKGKENTTKMITKWNASGYGSQNSNDMWKLIQTKVNAGWFVPSYAEWAAFASKYGITKNNYSSFGLKNVYWSSSQQAPTRADITLFEYGFMSVADVYHENSVRLAATF